MTMTVITRPVLPSHKYLSPLGGQSALALVPFPVWRKCSHRASATWNEVDVLLSEMGLRLARFEDCCWSTVFWVFRSAP